MKYHGGKKRIGSELASIIVKKGLSVAKKRGIEITGYLEPFVGAASVFEHIPALLGDDIEYKAGDTNKSLILMWKEIQRRNGEWYPYIDVERPQFDAMKNDPADPIKGFVGHHNTFRGIYFSSYITRTIKSTENALAKLNQTGKKLRNVKFSSGSYNRKIYSDLSGYIIYADPPYEGHNSWFYTDDDRGKKKVHFSKKDFMEWCHKMSLNNIVIISEYSMPKGFKEIYKIGKEKLFICL